MLVRLGIGTYTFGWAVGVVGRSPARPLTARDFRERAAAAGVDCARIADDRVRRARRMTGFVVEGAPAGPGQLDVPWLLDEVRRHGRFPSAILEPWTPPEDPLPGTIEKEFRWADESLRFPRPLFP